MLYLITNRKSAVAVDLYKLIYNAVEGGVDAIILREKDLSQDELLLMADRIKGLINGRNTMLIINGNLPVANEVKAHGYHTGYHQFMQGRPVFNGYVGVSVHSLEEAKNAERYGADYLLASHIYPTSCKIGLEPKGIEFISKIKNEVAIPVIALGGIHPGNVRDVMAAGADGIAVMSGIMASAAPLLAAKEFKEKLNMCKGCGI